MKKRFSRFRLTFSLIFFYNSIAQFLYKQNANKKKNKNNTEIGWNQDGPLLLVNSKAKVMENQNTSTNKY